MKKIRVRFAPSPTGNLHLGSVRTALFNWLFARQQGGTFVLRIEDTDLQRSKPEYEANILEGMKWLGLDWDEGPEVGGNYGPYHQTKRGDSYAKYVEILESKGLAYRCYETAEELEEERKAAEAKGVPYVYSRKRDMEEKYRESDRPYTVRFQVPEKTICLEDVIRGQVVFDLSLISDFIIMKSDGSPAYNFAVVVDDIEMDITHVIRGEDHISNTPRQMVLFEALGAAMPVFAHLPMILGPDKSKLSKRHAATSVTEYKEQGFLSDALFNFMCLLGWTPPDEKEILTKDELTSLFKLERVVKSGAVFDLKKLTWMNSQYIRQSGNIKELTSPYLRQEIKEKLKDIYTPEKLTVIYTLIKDNIEVLTDINEVMDVFIRDDESVRQIGQSFSFKEESLKALALLSSKLGVVASFNEAAITKALNDVLEETGLGKGMVFRPLRVALTGDSSGPDLITLMVILGKEKVRDRISTCL